MKDDTEAAVQTILETLHAVEDFQRRLHPTGVEDLVRKMNPVRSAFLSFLRGFESSADKDIRASLGPPMSLLDETMGLLVNVSTSDFQSFISGIMKAYRSFSRAQEYLYAQRKTFPGLQGFFLGPEALSRLAELDPPDAADHTGIIHTGLDKDPYARGSYSLYVPESYDGTDWPLVLAFHGGWGHGRDFLWTWLREARSRRFLLLAPTSHGRTWSILEPDPDREFVEHILEHASKTVSIDRKRILATGFSDGGTLALVLHLRDDSPFAACAPVSATVPRSSLFGAKGKCICWTHGSLDWMFPLWRVEKEAELLTAMGADMTFRAVSGLSHAYPREENLNILDWFFGAGTDPKP